MVCKIGQIGSYHRNLGDNVALMNIRTELNKLFPIDKPQWQNIQISDFWNMKSHQQIVNYFENLNVDALIVGGGGLIETEYSYVKTGWKLPFDSTILSKIKYPIFFVGIGINLFRGQSQYLSQQAFDNLRACIDHAKIFSLRNDGSKEKLVFMIETRNPGYDREEELNLSKIKVIPDPGLIFDFMKKGFETNQWNFRYVFQPAFNSNKEINLQRFLNQDNLDKILQIPTFFDEIDPSPGKKSIFPHTPKDYKFFDTQQEGSSDLFVIPQSQSSQYLHFDQTINTTRQYLNHDIVVAMRGHGQLITIGLNIPGIYLSTQDKVLDFARLHGFDDYCVDINDKNPDWFKQLDNKLTRLNCDEEYLETWYKIRNDKMYEWCLEFNEIIVKIRANLLKNVIEIMFTH